MKSILVLRPLLLLLLITSVGVIAVLPHTVSAAQPEPEPTSLSAGIDNLRANLDVLGLPTDKTFSEVLLDIIQFLLSLVAVIALGALIWGGIMYVLSLGEPEKAQKAKRIIMYAIIGVLIVGLSFAIIAALEGILTGGGGDGAEVKQPPVK